MTETSSGSTPPSNDTINVLPILSDAKAPISLTLTIDKSVSKVAAWIGWVLAIFVFVVSACCLLLGMNLAKQAQMDQDYKDASTHLMLVERRLMDKEAYMILNSQKIPGDDTHGPTGNMQRMTPKEK